MKIVKLLTAVDAFAEFPHEMGEYKCDLDDEEPEYRHFDDLELFLKLEKEGMHFGMLETTRGILFATWDNDDLESALFYDENDETWVPFYDLSND